MTNYQTEIADDRKSLAISVGDAEGHCTLSSSELDGFIKHLIKERRRMQPILPTPDLSTLVVNNGRNLRVEISGYPDSLSCQLTAADLESWVEELMEQRFVLSPPIPNEDPPKGTQFVSRSGRRWWVEPNVEKSRVTFAIQHSGLGWIWLSLTTENVDKVCKQLLNASKALSN